MSNKLFYPRKTMGLLVCFFLSILISGGLMAQNFSYYNQIKQINEYGAAPTKASMAYSLDSPVNKLTGAACFDIPIYTIKAGFYTLPISLHYETSGFKVATIASNVGMGWDLNAGGCITRTIKGFPDSYGDVGYCSQGDSADSIHDYVFGLTQIDNFDTVLYNAWDTSLFATLLQITDGLIDAEPDIYSFNFAGYSGSFIYDMDNNIHLIPEQNFNIERNGSGFVITVDNGDKYYFGEGDSKEIILRTYNSPLFWKVNSFEENTNNFFSYRYLYNENFMDWDMNYPITWYLTKIELADSNQQIQFEYEVDSVLTYLGTDESYMLGLSSRVFAIPDLIEGNNWVVHRINRYKYSCIPRLRRIVWENGKIDFLPSPDTREDLDAVVNHTHQIGGYSINRIVVSSTEDGGGNAENFSIILHLGYFKDMHTQYANPYNGIPIYYRSYYKRLRLDSISFLDVNEQKTYDYKFKYNMLNNNHCNSRNTSQVDYWGYFKPRSLNYYEDFNIERFVIKPTLYYYENGKENPLYNSVYSVWERSGENYTYCFEGNSDMIPDLIGSKEFTLNEVELPTGGIAQFEYELNDFFFDNQNISGPGVRVKAVHYGSYVNMTGFREEYRTEYSYDEENHSSGRIANIPTIGVRNFVPDYYGWLSGIYNGLREDCKTARQFSTVTDMGTTCASLVQYGKVTEKFLNNNESMGKTVYHHQLNLTAADSVLMVGDDVFIKKTKCRWSYLYEYPPIFIQSNCNYHNCFYIAECVDNTPVFTTPVYSWYNGFLCEKEQYDANDRLVESIEYKYSLKPSDDCVFYIQSKYLCKYSTVWQIPEFTSGNFNYQYEDPIYLYDILWGVNYYKTGVRQLDTIIHKYYCEGNDDLDNTTTQVFNYNIINYLREVKMQNSDGSVIKHIYNYPFEFLAHYPNSVYMEMFDRNMLNSVVEQYTTVDEKVTQGFCFEFDASGINNEFIKPKKLFRLQTNCPLTNFQPFGQDSHYELTDEMKYDPSSGNLVEIWDESDGRTTYVWGFHNSLLLAKIQNATDSEIRNALSCTMEALQEKTDTNELIGIFQNLRTSLPSARVTSYTYDLFQNLVSVTDPSGKTNRFEYDDALRLKLTRDVENNILQKYEYHYHQ